VRPNPLPTLAAIASAAILVACSGGGPGTVDTRSNPWFAVAAGGSQADVEAARASGANINARERRDRNTPLHMAAINGNVQAVNQLIAAGADLNPLDEDGRTPLMMALHHGQGQSAIALVKARADTDIRDRGKNTALMFAARRGQS
jgi:ankyrin repeat protein